MRGSGANGELSVVSACPRDSSMATQRGSTGRRQDLEQLWAAVPLVRRREYRWGAGVPPILDQQLQFPGGIFYGPLFDGPRPSREVELER